MLMAAVTLWSSALVAVACSDDGETRPTTFPTQGGSSTSSGGSSGSTSSSSGSSSGGTVDSGASSSGGSSIIACAPIKNDVEIRTIAAARTETGGTIPDGTYHLTEARQLTAGGDGGTTGKKKGATLVFSGTKVAWQYNTNTIGDPINQCCIGSYSVVGADMELAVQCTGGGATGFEPSYSVVTSGTPQILWQLGASNDTYTKE